MGQFKKCMYVQPWLKFHVMSSPSDGAPFDTQSSPSPSSSASRQTPVDSDQATREFIDFLKPLKSGREIFKQCRAFTESMVYKRVSLKSSILFFSHCQRSLPAFQGQNDSHAAAGSHIITKAQRFCVLAGFCPVLNRLKCITKYVFLWMK